MVVPSIDLFRLRCSRLFCPQNRKGVFAVAIAGWMTACAASPNYQLGADTPGVPLDTAASPSASASPEQFNFPQASCSDRETTPTSTWYPVVIKGGNLDEIRAKYCQDAIGTIQAITGEPTVQVASFTSYEKAQRFAEQVGGTVDAQQVAQATDSPTPGINPSSSPAASPSPQPSPAIQATGSGTLNTSDGSPINIRTSASTDAPVQEAGESGESVQILSSSSGNDGYTWYNVQTASGISGWVRGDLISANSISSDTAGSTAQPSPTASASGGLAATPTPGASPESTPSAARQSSVLTASDPDASINVRTSASTDAPVQTTAYAGDPIRIVDRTQGSDGYTWYSVQFESGATGWVRGDFVQN